MMTWTQVPICILALSVLAAPSSLAAVCPISCKCETTRDGLHRATCSNLAELYKFSLRQRHHNINALDLSHNNITKISHELDRFTEIVALDLSTNGITEIGKFLNNAKKLVHLNLANNRLKQLSLKYLPASVSSLDLSNNILQDLPTDISHLKGLEHLQLEGNPLHCTCENIKSRDQVLIMDVHIDKVKCISPEKFKGHEWLALKKKDACKMSEDLDIMMGDQPVDAERIGEETTILKSMPLKEDNVLGEAKVLHSSNPVEDDDSRQFLRVSKSATSISPLSNIEGSGEEESTTMSEPKQERMFNADLMTAEGIIPADNIYTTDEPPEEGSGEGSGMMGFFGKEVEETTTPVIFNISDLEPVPVHRFFEDENSSSTEFPPVIKPGIFLGGPDWHSHTDSPITEKVATPLVTQDTTVSQKLETPLTKTSATTDDKTSPHKTGTYVCIAVIVVLLVGLIGFAIIKGQMRKRRDRRLLRQQKRDVEKASKEMVDMNKSLLGKPAVIDVPVEKKINGKYELVPTHESLQKKSENGDIGNGMKPKESNGVRTDSPRDTNQNKSSSKDNNLTEPIVPVQDTSFESVPSQDSRKDTHSLSSEDIFVPLNDEDAPKTNGNVESDVSQPLINGDLNAFSDFLSPSREYVPVYSPDMGRVRIKMTETPKPKTPVLVTRSRSNAGDIIITPSLDGNARKSTT